MPRATLAGRPRFRTPETFLAPLETRTRRRLHALKRGPKPKNNGAASAAK